MKNFRSKLAGGSLLMTASLVGILLGSAISLVSTLFGLIAFLKSTGAGNDYTILVAIGFTAFVQLTLLVAAIKLRQAKWTKKPIYLATYLVVAFVSVCFSVGFWTANLDGGRLAQESALAPLASTGQQILAFKSTYANLVPRMSEIDTLSSERAVEEAQFGTSCGYQTAAVKGPRYSQRVEDATFMKANAAIIADQYRRVDSLLTVFFAVRDSFDPKQAAVTQRQLRIVVSDLGQLAKAPVLHRVRSYLRDRIATRGMRLERQGVVFDCPDPEFDALAAIVISEIDGLPEIPPPTAITLFDASNASDAVRLVFDKSLGFVGNFIVDIWPSSKGVRRSNRINAIQNGPADQSVTVQLGNLPLAAGIFVDLLILFSALTMPRRGWLGEVVTPVIEKMAGQALIELPSTKHLELIRLLIMDAIEADLSLYEVVRVSMDDKSRIVVSPDSPSERADLLLRLMDFLCLTGDAEVISCVGWKVKRVMKRKEIDSDYVPERAWELKKSIRPEKIRLAIMILEAQVRADNNQGGEKKAA